MVLPSILFIKTRLFVSTSVRENIPFYCSKHDVSFLWFVSPSVYLSLSLSVWLNTHHPSIVDSRWAISPINVAHSIIDTPPCLMPSRTWFGFWSLGWSLGDVEVFP